MLRLHKKQAPCRNSGLDQDQKPVITTDIGIILYGQQTLRIDIQRVNQNTV